MIVALLLRPHRQNIILRRHADMSIVSRGPRVGADVHGRDTGMWELEIRAPTDSHPSGWGKASTTANTKDSDVSWRI